MWILTNLSLILSVHRQIDGNRLDCEIVFLRMRQFGRIFQPSCNRILIKFSRPLLTVPSIQFWQCQQILLTPETRLILFLFRINESYSYSRMVYIASTILIFLKMLFQYLLGDTPVDRSPVDRRPVDRKPFPSS